MHVHRGKGRKQQHVDEENNGAKKKKRQAERSKCLPTEKKSAFLLLSWEAAKQQKETDYKDNKSGG